MQSTLPEKLDFIQKAKFGCEIHGNWPINRLQRLPDLLLNDQGNIEAKVKFGQIDKLRFVTGDVSAQLEVTCQRCMQAMSLNLSTSFKLGLVADEDKTDHLPEGYEPYLVDDEKMSLPELLEDELLLAMPIVTMHEHDCSDYLQAQEKRKQQEADQQSEKENPFSVLKDLL